MSVSIYRLAVTSYEGKKGGWSLALSLLWKNPKTGRIAPSPKKPRIVINALKIEDVNFYGSSPKNPFRQLFGYAISAKRYALYSRVENDIHIEKASGHGLGYLFAPKERKKREEDEETPQWVLEAWEFLLRRALKLPSKDPNWLDLPTMMRMVVTTPNVFKQRRPEWLGPFNFFLFPMLSETFGGYPKGFDKSNFIFITPYGVRPQKMEFTRGCQSSGRRVLSNHDAADNKSG